MQVPPTHAPTDFDLRADRVVDRYLALTKLRALLGPSAAITPEFLAAYCQSPIHGVARERLLMAALGDVARRSEAPQLNPPLVLRTLDFLDYHPTEPLNPWVNRFERDHLPQRLRRIFAALDPTASTTSEDWRPRLDAQQFLRLALVVPAVHAELDASVPGATGDSAFSDPRVASRLRDLLPRFVLTEEGARRLLVEPQARHAFTHYFNTGHHGLDLRNALLFYAEWLDRTDFHVASRNKVSGRIDLTLLGLSRRGSHPLIALATQLIGLGVHGLLDDTCAVWDDPVLGSGIRQLAEAREHFGIDDLARRHLQRWMLDPSNIERWHAVLSHEGPNARYTKVILFDLQHLLDSESVPGLRQGLSRYYGGVNSAAILRFTLDHYRALDDEFADQLATAATRHRELFTGMRSRSLANSLFYARHLVAQGADPCVDLPLAAMVSLGALRTPRTEAIAASQARGQRTVRRSTTRNATSLPLLERLMPDLMPSRKRRARTVSDPDQPRRDIAPAALRSTASRAKKPSSRHSVAAAVPTQQRTKRSGRGPSKPIDAAVLAIGDELARIRNEDTATVARARRRPR